MKSLKFFRQLIKKTQLVLQEAFLATDVASVKKAVPTVSAMLKKVNMGLLKGKMHNHWMASLKLLTESLNQMQVTNDIEQQRLAYANFNNALYDAIKMFGIVNTPIYYQFCPMAWNGEGAYWLSASKEIKNPYYGEAMLTCGETKEVINK